MVLEPALPEKIGAGNLIMTAPQRHRPATTSRVVIADETGRAAVPWVPPAVLKWRGMVGSARRPWRVMSAVTLGAVAVVGWGLVSRGQVHVPGLTSVLGPEPTVAPTSNCFVDSDTGRLRLDPAQAANATTIAAVGKRNGLSDRAVTVAFVAALQESKLRNLPYGDLDSLGIFQQRPSQGWGVPAELLSPKYAASAFYDALVRVPGWESMPVGDAAQAVQRSAGPAAYAPWERQARILAAALTGETPAAFSCRFVDPVVPGDPDQLEPAVSGELGLSASDTALTPSEGWRLASWLIAHASAYHVSSVSFQGRQWTLSSGTWDARLSGGSTLEIGRG